MVSSGNEKSDAMIHESTHIPNENFETKYVNDNYRYKEIEQTIIETNESKIIDHELKKIIQISMEFQQNEANESISEPPNYETPKFSEHQEEVSFILNILEPELREKDKNFFAFQKPKSKISSEPTIPSTHKKTKISTEQKNPIRQKPTKSHHDKRIYLKLDKKNFNPCTLR